MSAYIVDRDHIAYLVAAAQSNQIGSRHGKFGWLCPRLGWRHFDSNQGAEAVGQMLWDECIKSVSARYPGADPQELPGVIGEDYTFHDSDVPIMHRPINPVDVLKAISCYDYQSCEHEGWEKSEAHNFCEALHHAAVNALPGYDDAPWGAPENWRGARFPKVGDAVGRSN